MVIVCLTIPSAQLLDVSSTYPNAQLGQNVSKETTVLEAGVFKGFNEQKRREFGINLTGGRSNALELCIKYFKYPSPAQLLGHYDQFQNSIVESPVLSAA